MKRALLITSFVAAFIVLSAQGAGACGGFFCQNNPVDQTGERIVFTVNDDGTITTLIEIQYFGTAEDFSWILPIPEAISAEDLAVPEDGPEVFDELHRLTDVQIIAPPVPDCAAKFRDAAVAELSAVADDGGVEIFASGEVGPFGFDVIGSDDPDALIEWLRDNNYRVTPEMEPLVDVYVEQDMAFVAMRLLDGEDAASIAPIEITYGGTEPMIPLILTAVAAQPNMPVWVWIFGDERAVGTNFANMEIANEELTFFPFGGNDYTFLVQQRANALDGQAFITEFAGPSDGLAFESSWLQARSAEQPYLTRLNTYIDPAEMTVDPVFGFDGDLPDVSNVRDASGLDGLYDCQRAGEDGGGLFGLFGGDSDAIDPRDGSAVVVAFTPGRETEAETSTTSTAVETSTADTIEGSAQGATDPAPQSDEDGFPILPVFVVGLIGLIATGGLVARHYK